MFWKPCCSASNKLVTRVHHSIKAGKVCQVKILRLNCYMEIKTRLPAVAAGSTIIMTDSRYSVYSSVEPKVINLFPNREPRGFRQYTHLWLWSWHLWVVYLLGYLVERFTMKTITEVLKNGIQYEKDNNEIKNMNKYSYLYCRLYCTF